MRLLLYVTSKTLSKGPCIFYVIFQCFGVFHSARVSSVPYAVVFWHTVFVKLVCGWFSDTFSHLWWWQKVQRYSIFNVFLQTHLFLLKRYSIFKVFLQTHLFLLKRYSIFNVFLQTHLFLLKRFLFLNTLRLCQVVFTWNMSGGFI